MSTTKYIFRLIVLWFYHTMLFLTVFQQYTYPCFPGVLLTSILPCILSKPLATFHNDHDITLAEPRIEPVTSCSQLALKFSSSICYGLRYGARHNIFRNIEDLRSGLRF